MRRPWFFALLLIASLSTACKQGEGDRCQLDSDCEDGLICCFDPDRIIEGGVCRPEDKCDLTRQDGGTDGAVDLGPVDGLPDKAPADDEGTPDEGTPDEGTDKGTPDEGTPDTATADVTKAPDQKSVADTFTVDQASAQDK